MSKEIIGTDFNKMIAVDFDGTLCTVAEYPGIGEPNVPLIEKLSKLRTEGYRVFLWTVRYGEPLNDAIVWANKLGLSFDGINQNPFNAADPFQRKIYATYYLDDRAITPADFLEKVL